MHEDILDHEEKPSDDYYYKKSKKNLMVAGIFILTSLTFVYFSFKIILLVDVISVMGSVLFLSGILSSTIGVYNGIQSFIKKEKSRVGRWIVFIVNLIFSGLFFMVLIANILDLIRVFG